MIFCFPCVWYRFQLYVGIVKLVAIGLVDELLLHFAPMLLGDRARGMFALPALSELSEREDLKITDIRRVGGDLRLLARFAA